MDNHYNRNIFYNCPFDDIYQPVFEAALFTIYRCGFLLRCAKEFNDSGRIRIDNIVQLIRDSKYGIHDLCRVELDGNLQLPRFNMPLELGIFIGATKFGDETLHGQKEYLILDSDNFRFKAFISDISGQDIKSYNNSIPLIIKRIRDWLSNKTVMALPSAKFIHAEYDKFLKDLPGLCKKQKWYQDELTYWELTGLVQTWIKING
jgi:hypothetical protein